MNVCLEQTARGGETEPKRTLQAPMVCESLVQNEHINADLLGQNEKGRRLTSARRNLAAKGTKTEGTHTLWEERMNRWSLPRQWILDQEDIVFYKMISPPLMETLSSCYTGEFAVALARYVQDETSTSCVASMSEEQSDRLFARPVWSFLNDLGPQPFRFSKMHACHLLWNHFVKAKSWKCVQLDFLPWAFRKNAQQNAPPLKVHTKHFKLHTPFGFSLQPSKSEAALKSITLDDLAFEEEGVQDTLVCLQEVFLFLFFNQFLLTPRFLQCAWRPLYGEIALVTEKYDGDLTVISRTMLRHLPKSQLLAEISQEILFLVRGISLLGWFCFDLKPQNMVFRWCRRGGGAASGRSKLSIKLIDFDARYYTNAQLPFSVLFWCNLYALCLNFEGTHRWKNRLCGNFWWWEEGTASLLLQVLKADLSVGLRTCSIMWSHLAMIEQNNPNQFIDPFYVTWYYCKKQKHTFSSQQELHVQITAFLYSQWTALANLYLNT